MADVENNLYFKQYKECEQLYDQGKYTECTRLPLHNMTDLMMPRYVEIKTLILLVGAENDSWKKAETCRVRAERIYALTKQSLVGRTPTADEKKAEDDCMKDLRHRLDEMLEHQANDASEIISLNSAHYPGREGNLVDFLYARKMFATLDEDEEMAEVGSADDEEMVEPEFDDDDILLEDDGAVRAAEE